MTEFPKAFQWSNLHCWSGLGGHVAKPTSAACMSWIQATRATLAEFQASHLHTIKNLYFHPPLFGPAPLQFETCWGAASSLAWSSVNGSVPCLFLLWPSGTAPLCCCSAFPRLLSLVCSTGHKGNYQEVISITYDIQVSTSERAEDESMSYHYPRPVL